MIRIEAHCWLDWWANQVTLLASAEAAVTFAISATGWTATGRLTNDEDREGFAFLCDLDAVFSLRFDDDTIITDRRRFLCADRLVESQLQLR